MTTPHERCDSRQRWRGTRFIPLDFLSRTPWSAIVSYTFRSHSWQPRPLTRKRVAKRGPQ